MASARAPAQWPLTNTETTDSFESWRQNLLDYLSFDTSFAHMLKPGYKWERQTEAKPYRGFKDDGDNVTANKMTASQKSSLLEMLLGEIANYCPVIARNVIVKKSTSLDDIWNAIRMHFGFQKSGVHFCDYLDIMTEPNESPEDLFQRMTAFINDNLMSKEQPITHHGVKPTKDEEFSPTLENLVFLRWLHLLHPGLPSLVKQRYASDLRSKTLASLKLEISASLDSLLRELGAPKEVNNEDMPLQSRFACETNMHSPRSKSCPICKQALRRKYDHCLLKCPYLPDEDRRSLTRRRVPIVNEFEETSKLEGTSTQSAGKTVEYSKIQFPSTSQAVERVVDGVKSQRTQDRHILEKESEEETGYESAVEELEDDAKELTNDTKDESSDCEEYESAVEELVDDEDDKELTNDSQTIQLSESVFVYQNRNMSDHGNVFEGEIRSGVYGVRVCAIKIDTNSEQIVREARILSKVNSHTHVVSLIQSGLYKTMFEDRVYIALDKCHKHNLDRHITFQNESGVKFNLSEALEYSKQIIAGVTFIHENLIIHKDLKSSNILLSQNKSTIKVADFGQSQEIKSTSSKVYSKNQFGTNGFRPVESFGDNWVSLKSDIFSLGVVLYFVLSNGKSPFGDNSSLWAHNIQNGVMDLSHLLVSKASMFKHLIKLMLGKERCRRPSIWQVADHPCWTEKKVKCTFDYGFMEETDDADVKISEQGNQNPNDFESETESRLQLLRALQKIGFDRPPVQKSIIIFDLKSEYLQCFDPKKKSLARMLEFNNEMKRYDSFTSVSIGDYIYVLMDYRSMYRLKFCDVTATWKRMANLICYHGYRSPAVVAAGSIILAGGSGPSSMTSVTKYDPSPNRWEKLTNKGLSTHDSANVASRGFVYCIGGSIDGIVVTNRVERLNVVSKSWNDVASMREARCYASAVECRGNLFVAGGRDRDHKLLNSVEKYDPGTNQWTIMKPMSTKRYNFRCHLIEGYIYAVGPENIGIERYNVENNAWEVVQISEKEDLRIRESVLVKMKK